MTGLRVIKILIEKLDAEGIYYCHWKSNEHLHAAMVAATDLDILIEKNKSLTINRILSKIGFKHFAPTSFRMYPAVEDYLSFDEDTGRLIHLHLHYQLTVGENHLKGYRLPWEHLVLSTRQFDAEEQVYVADPNVEMLLLLVRAALKIRTRNRFLACFGIPYFSGNTLVEYQWLKERTQPEQVFSLAKEHLGDKAATLVSSMVAGTPSLGQLITFRKKAACILRLFKNYGKIEGVLRRWFRELKWFHGALCRRYHQKPRPYRRTASTGGLIVALIGSDGSGKSTISKTIRGWLSWKIDVFFIYFGSGDGSSSLMRLPLIFVLKLLKKKRLMHLKGVAIAVGEYNSHNSEKKKWQRLKSLARVPWAIVLAYEKRKKLRNAWRSRNLGMVVICDRYPQCQVMGFNDGPLLSHWLGHHNKLLKYIANWESTPYRWSKVYPPDLVIKLNVTPEVALKRKQHEMSIKEISLRVETIKKLSFPHETKVVTVNADKPVEQVLMEVKQLVWEKI